MVARLRRRTWPTGLRLDAEVVEPRPREREPLAWTAKRATAWPGSSTTWRWRWRRSGTATSPGSSPRRRWRRLFAAERGGHPPGDRGEAARGGRGGAAAGGGGAPRRAGRGGARGGLAVGRGRRAGAGAGRAGAAGAGRGRAGAGGRSRCGGARWPWRWPRRWSRAPATASRRPRSGCGSAPSTAWSPTGRGWWPATSCSTPPRTPGASCSPTRPAGTSGLQPPPRGDLTRADLLRLLAFPAFDGLFRRSGLAELLRSAGAAVGLDAGVAARIGETTRVAAWPGAHAVGGRISFRPRGGLPDWLDLLDAAGRSATGGAPAAQPRDATFAAGLRLAPLRRCCSSPASWRPGSSCRGGSSRGDAGPGAASRSSGSAPRPRRRAWPPRSSAGCRARAGARPTARRSRPPATRPGTACGRRATPRPGRCWRGWPASRRASGCGSSLRERFDEDWWRNPRAPEHLAGLLAAGRFPETEQPSAPAAARGLVRLLETGGAR